MEELSSGTLRTCFRGGERVFPVFIREVDGHYVFAVIPFASGPDIDDMSSALLERLLTCNREMNMAKFSLDEEGDVVLSVEYPIRDLDPSEVRDALDVLSFYADKYREEIGKLLQGQPAA